MTVGDAINRNCPWSGDLISSDSRTSYQGHTVAFCNPGCRDKYDKAVRAFDAAMKEHGLHAPMKAGFLRFALYNRWMNDDLYDIVAKIPDTDYRRDLGAFFKSIHGTLNHILVWDMTWLQRFAEHQISYPSVAHVLDMPRATSHDQILYDNLSDLKNARSIIDDMIQEFVLDTSEDDYASTFSYIISTGEIFYKNFGGMIQHLFNHQTHYRGQITVLLSQQGIDYGVTDLLATLPDLDSAQ